MQRPEQIHHRAAAQHAQQQPEAVDRAEHAEPAGPLGDDGHVAQNRGVVRVEQPARQSGEGIGREKHCTAGGQGTHQQQYHPGRAHNKVHPPAAEPVAQLAPDGGDDARAQGHHAGEDGVIAHGTVALHNRRQHHRHAEGKKHLPQPQKGRAGDHPVFIFFRKADICPALPHPVPILSFLAFDPTRFPPFCQ